jgi:hypothetical protein
MTATPVSARPRARDRLLGARAEEDAVGQAGQRVVQGEPLGDEGLAAGALDGDQGQGEQRQQHRRRVECEHGQPSTYCATLKALREGRLRSMTSLSAEAAATASCGPTATSRICGWPRWAGR